MQKNSQWGKASLTYNKSSDPWNLLHQEPNSDHSFYQEDREGYASCKIFITENNFKIPRLQALIAEIAAIVLPRAGYASDSPQIEVNSITIIFYKIASCTNS